MTCVSCPQVVLRGFSGGSVGGGVTAPVTDAVIACTGRVSVQPGCTEDSAICVRLRIKSSESERLLNKTKEVELIYKESM